MTQFNQRYRSLFVFSMASLLSTSLLGCVGDTSSGTGSLITLTQITPNSGPSGGGLTVTIQGTGFTVGTDAQTIVTIGGNDCTTPHIVSATAITCLATAHAPGKVDVIVHDSSGDIATLAASFTYNFPTGTIFEYPVMTANSGPSGITAGPDGNLWFTQSNTGTNRISKITVDGAVTEFPLPTTNAFPGTVINGPDGNIWFVDEVGHLSKVTPSSGVVEQFSAVDPRTLTVGPDGNLWVPQFNGGKVNVYSTAGALLHSFAANTNPSGLQLDSIISGPGGNLWMDTFSGQNLIKMTPAGVTTTFVLTSPLIQDVLRGMAAGPDGNIWLCAEDSNAIVRVTPTGTATAFVIPTANSHPNSLIAGPDGNLWFVETHGNKIGRITPNGSISEYPLPTASASPYVIVVGPDHNLWFTEGNGNKIGKIYP